MMEQLIVYGVDVGKVGKSLGWVRLAESHHPSDLSEKGDATDAQGLRKLIADDVNSGSCKVAVGFECPLFVPIRDEDPMLLRSRRGDFERNRAFSAAAGQTSLITGLVQVPYFLGFVTNVVETATSSRNGFQNGKKPLLIWEAFISEQSEDRCRLDGVPMIEHNEHVCDAYLAARLARDELLGESSGASVHSPADFFNAQRGLDLAMGATGTSPLVDDLESWDPMIIKAAKPRH